MKFKVRSVHGEDQYAQVTKKARVSLTHFWPLEKKSQAHYGLVNFINSYGIPETMITDGAPEEGKGQGSEWFKTEMHYHIQHQFTEPHSPWQNQEAEIEIQQIRRGVKNLLLKSHAPKRR